MIPIEFKKTHIFTVGIIVLLLVASTFIYLYWWYQFSIITKKDIPADVYVGSVIGLNADTDAVHFGIIRLGSFGMRELNIQNLGIRTIVSIQALGKIKDILSVSENDFIMEPNENKTIYVFIEIPDDARKSYINGTIRTTFRKYGFIDLFTK